MQEPFCIKKVAVLGAGVMGAQIAAQSVNAGIETLLFDLAAKEGPPNGIVDKAIINLTKLKPSPLATAQSAAYLQAKNYDQHLAALNDCDLVIEAIAERMDLKEDLYRRIVPHLSKHCILASNTSGLSVNRLSSILPETFRERFCGIHFFNPPRYMHLAELIPTESTSLQLLDQLETWLSSRLGKGVVRAKDTPNFIANRIGVFSLLATIHLAEEMGLGLDEVDALTGALLGRPKSATFRTMDVVGLDTMQHVVQTMEQQLESDPWHASFQLPLWLKELIKNGALGQKTGQGIYRKNGKMIEVFDLNLKEYRPVKAEVSSSLKRILTNKDSALRMEELMSSEDKQSQFLGRYFRELFLYCAYHLKEIADNVRDVDLAIRWGFGWQQGPFETWQEAGFEKIIAAIQNDISHNKGLAKVKLPEWLKEITAFYSKEGAYSPLEKSYKPRSSLKVYQRQFFPAKVLLETSYPKQTLFENEGIRLWHLKDEIAVLSFKSKSNTIGQAVLDGLQTALELAEKSYKGLIIYQNDANNFSSGADLRQVAGLLQEKNLQAVEAMIAEFQQTVMRIKYSSIPTVAALRGRALGGGCELMLHCSSVVAAFESYPGLVEIGVGLLPAGGGCKELALRSAFKAENAELMSFIQPSFEQIAMAKVASSALEAKQFSYLRNSAPIIMNADEVLYAAVAQIQAFNAANYQPPLKTKFPVAGREGHARLQVGLVNLLEGGFISEYDYYLANEIAKVITGGEVNQGEKVDEEWILEREKTAFIHLAGNPLTQARIAHLLETGKPLRN